MSLNFSTDTSVQLSYASFPLTTPKLDNYATSNQLLNVSNILPNSSTLLNYSFEILDSILSLLFDYQK